MNILGLVFSLLLILTYGFYATWDKQTASARLRTTYVGHERANRAILNSYQSEVYKTCGKRAQKASPKPEEEEITEEEAKAPTNTKATDPETNRECAKLNIWPLIQEGRDNHPILYDLAAKLIRTFYSGFSNEKRFEYFFLDHLLAAAKTTHQDAHFALQKVDLNTPKLQTLYYKMLKGTKEWNLSNQTGYPPLLDYLKADPSTQKICLCHAHPDMITVIFNQAVAVKLYAEIHKQDAPLFTEELIEKICFECHFISPDPELIKLIDFSRTDHDPIIKTWIAEDKQSHVTLRKNLYVKG